MESVEKYHIDYNIDMEKLTFSGKETIKGVSDGKIWLNAAAINIEKIMVNGNLSEFTANEKEEEITLKGEHKGPFELEIHFNGKISDGMNGIYYSKEKDYVFVSTQFEATGARFAFPCVDRPDFKAIFSLTLHVPSDYEAISNMQVVDVKESEGKKSFRFHDTPKMSTYLLYIGAARYDHIEGKHGNKPVYVSAAKGKFKLTNTSLEMAISNLQYFEKYFGIDYELPKLHLIAVPEFAFGAMENWGAITFREVELLIGESTSSVIKKRVDLVIAHELAHQWFGDLVTMKWWDDIWLNESFATFMSNKALESRHPDWEAMSDFITTELAHGMVGDSLKNTHPIHVEVNHPGEISQIFDEISYSKGGSILRMIEAYVGKENFRKGVSSYLKNNMFSNAKGNALWEAIEKESGMPVSMIMNAWITKPGYPIVKATMNGSKISLHQERFFLDGSTDSSVYPIPLTAAYNGSSKSFLMDKSDLDIDASGFLYLNPDMTGFYRVLYDVTLQEKILRNAKEVDTHARWGMLSDAEALFESGKMPMDQFMGILGAMESDQSYIIRDELCSIIGSLSSILKKNEKILEFGRKYLRNHLSIMGPIKENEPINVSVIRGRMESTLTLIDEKYASERSSEFTDFEKKSPDSRQAVAFAFAKHTNDLDAMVKKLETMTVDEDRNKILLAMGFLNGDNLLSSVWEMIENGKIKKQDSIRFLFGAARSSTGRKFIADRFEKIIDTIERFFSGTGYTSRSLEMMIPFVGLDYREPIEKFASGEHNKSWELGIKKGMEYLQIYTNLNKRVS